MSIKTPSVRFGPISHERWRVAVVVGGLTAIFGVLRYNFAPDFSSDLDQLWHAARALLAGRNPYEVVGPGRNFEWAWEVFYPLPAILLVAPFSLLPVQIARIVFSALTGGVLGFAMGPRWKMLWPLFLSEAYFLAISRNQWAPFILAAIWLPAFGFFLAAKPNIGIIAVAGQRRDSIVRAVSLAAALIIVSFLVRPSWLGEWLALVRSAPNKEIALLQPGGFLLLAALIMWRSADGRILLASAAVPQTPSVYDLLVLFALCRSKRQALILALLTHAVHWGVLLLGPYPDFDSYYESLARLSVGLVLVPVTVLALMNHRIPGGNGGAFLSDHERELRLLGWFDLMLLFILLFVSSLQIWLLFLR